jgi:hypothetical protein
MIYDVIRKDLVEYETELSLAISSNPCIIGSCEPGKQRISFFEDFERLPFDVIINKYLGPDKNCLKYYKEVVKILKSLFQ